MFISAGIAFYNDFKVMYWNMLNGKTVAVVIPAYNEEKQIESVIRSMPAFVDRIIIVDDCSTDNTLNICRGLLNTEVRSLQNLQNKDSPQVRSKYDRAQEVAEKITEKEEKYYVPSEILNADSTDRIILIRHLVNSSVGAAIATGYKWCLDNNIYCSAVMAGDGQMDPSELQSICQPIIDNSEIDYVKGNRLSHRSAFFVVPKIRYFGNSILSLLTKIASGYWRVSDTQTGYTAISLKALKAIRVYDIYKSYGCPNDILVKLNIAFCTLKEVPIKPVYSVGEQSKMKILKVIPAVSWLLFKSFWKRLYVKYLFRDFHPLFLFYHLSFALLITNIPFLFQIIESFRSDVTLSTQSLIIFVFLATSGLQSLFFAMWMDMTDNDRLQIF